jgi:Uma2 family endonuclease
MAITQRLTLDEFLALPAEEPALELEPDGTVVQKVSPQGQHSRLQLALCERINGFAEGRRLALAFPELRVVFGGAAYVPDVSVFGWDRIPRTVDGDVDNVFGAPPDVAIEIVSPEQSTNALVRRCLWYVDNGVDTALLMDPADRSVVRFVQDETTRVLRGDDRIDFGSVLADFTISVSELFRALRLEP